MTPHELSALIWQERNLLEQLLFKLKVEQLLLTAGESRWLSHATAEVESVLGRAREAGLSRDVASQVIADQWGLEADAGLRALAENAPADGPWREIFGKHLAAMTQLVEQIGQVRDSNARIVAHGVRSTQETLATLAPAEVGTYDASGVTAPERDQSRLFDTLL